MAKEEIKKTERITIDDPEIMEGMIKLRGIKALEQASDSLKQSKYFISKCIRNFGVEVLEYADELCADEKFMLGEIKTDYRVLSYAKGLTNNVDFMIEACRINPKCAEFVDKSVADEFDNETAMIVMENKLIERLNGRLYDGDLKTIPREQLDRFLKNPEFVLAAIRGEDAHYFNSASESSKEDVGFIVRAINNCYKIPTEIEAEGKKLQIPGEAYIVLNMSPKLRDNPESILEIIGELHRYDSDKLFPIEALPEKYSNDIDFLVKASKKNILYSSYAAGNLASDPDFIKTTVKIALEQLGRDCPEESLAVKILETCPCGLDKEFIKQICSMRFERWIINPNPYYGDDKLYHVSGRDVINEQIESGKLRPEIKEILKELDKEAEEERLLAVEQEKHRRNPFRRLFGTSKKKGENPPQGPTQG